ncbi:MAG: phage integrase SAM-like domain-containing protein [Raineya sp.]|jgi:integrase|nr:phage integrase SAM-like domain-containing protein [Raineya sp.]
MINSNINIQYKPSYKPSKEGFIRIRCVLVLDKSSIEMQTGVKIQLKEWNSDTKSIINNPNQEKLLIAYKAKLDSIIANYKLANRPFTLLEIRNTMEGKVRYKTLLNAFDDCLDAHKYDYSPSNIKKWNEHRRLIVKFIKLAYQKDDLWLNEVTKQTPLDFKNFLFGEYGTTKYDADYAKKVGQTINKVMKFALQMDYTDYNHFELLKIKGKKKRLPLCLSQEQVQKIASHNFTDKHLAKMAKLFVFQCYTGLAFVDLHNLTPDCIKEYKGKKYIVILRQKTASYDCLSNIPIFPEAQNIIDYFDGIDKFPKPYNHIYNKALKVIGEVCEIPIKLHTHLGRKTFTDYALHSLYLSGDEVRSMLGQVDDRSLGIYGKINMERIHNILFKD